MRVGSSAGLLGSDACPHLGAAQGWHGLRRLTSRWHGLQKMRGGVGDLGDQLLDLALGLVGRPFQKIVTVLRREVLRQLHDADEVEAAVAELARDPEARQSPGRGIGGRENIC